MKKLGEEWERKDDDGEQNIRKKKNSLSLPSLSLASLALQNKDNQLTGLDFVLRASPAASPAGPKSSFRPDPPGFVPSISAMP